MNSPSQVQNVIAWGEQFWMGANCYDQPDDRVLHDHELFPSPDRRTVLVNSDDQTVTVLRYASVSVTRPGLVALQHVLNEGNEGEGYKKLAEWREAHESFWTPENMRQALDDPNFTVDEQTLVVLKTFYVEVCRGHGRELKAQRQSTILTAWITLHRRAMSCHRV